eukprot:766151-Pelagomonas_calceolata.AAC.4
MRSCRFFCLLVHPEIQSTRLWVGLLRQPEKRCNPDTFVPNNVVCRIAGKLGALFSKQQSNDADLTLACSTFACGIAGKLGALFSNNTGSEPRSEMEQGPSLQQEDGSSSGSSSREGGGGHQHRTFLEEGEQASSSGNKRDVSARALPAGSNAARVGALPARSNAVRVGGGVRVSSSIMSSCSGASPATATLPAQRVQCSYMARNVCARVVCDARSVSLLGRCSQASKLNRALPVFAPSSLSPSGRAKAGHMQAHKRGCSSSAVRCGVPTF